ncbi:MAG: FGGY-family carbohydrate kinase, partial [Lachnospiraceae bacterium]|nr:FGGY-family carbohydrate kinase [Lachnospiraceae bacterium]
TKLNEGRPLYVRMPNSKLNLANFMRAQLYTSLGAVKLGMDILQKEEHVKIDRITGHGGLFTTPGCVQKYLAAAIHTPVTVMSTATEGGPWGMALLAAYLLEGGQDKETLPDYLNRKIFDKMEGTTLAPDPETEEGYETFIRHYKDGLAVEKSAITSVNW